MIANQQVTNSNTKLDLKFITKCICLNLAILIIGVLSVMMVLVLKFRYFPVILVPRCDQCRLLKNKSDIYYCCCCSNGSLVYHNKPVAHWIIKECCKRLSISFINSDKQSIRNLFNGINDKYIEDPTIFKKKLGFYYYLIAMNIGFPHSLGPGLCMLIIINIVLAIAGGIIWFKKSVSEFLKFYESGLWASVVIVSIGCVVSLLSTQIKLLVYSYSSKKRCFVRFLAFLPMAVIIFSICLLILIIVIVVMASKQLLENTNANESIEDSNQLKNSTSELTNANESIEDSNQLKNSTSKLDS